MATNTLAPPRQKSILRANWLRVSKANPRAICGKPNWCMVSEDGTRAICARVESELGKGTTFIIELPVSSG